jgi:hypothetical protein
VRYPQVGGRAVEAGVDEAVVGHLDVGEPSVAAQPDAGSSARTSKWVCIWIATVAGSLTNRWTSSDSRIALQILA